MLSGWGWRGRATFFGQEDASDACLREPTQHHLHGRIADGSLATFLLALLFADLFSAGASVCFAEGFSFAGQQLQVEETDAALMELSLLSGRGWWGRATFFGQEDASDARLREPTQYRLHGRIADGSLATLLLALGLQFRW